MHATETDQPEEPDEGTETIVEEDAAAPVPADPPSTPDDTGSFVDRVRSRGRRPIWPGWLLSWKDFRTAFVVVVGFYAHTVGFHLIRAPWYALRFVCRGPSGALRFAKFLARWVFDWEGHPVRLAAADTKKAEEYLKLCKQRDRRVRTRLTATSVLGGLTAAVALVIIAVSPGWTVPAFAALVSGVFGYFSTGKDNPIVGHAVTPARIRKLTSNAVVRALTVIGVSGIKTDEIHFPAPITRDGPGWRADVDLPAGVTAAEVAQRRDKLAAALGRPLGCVWPENDATVHPGRLVLYVSDHDMATSPQPVWPLAKSGTVDIFAPVPVGTDQRGRWIYATLIFASVLIGALPRMGKSVFLRCLLLIAALDFRVELHVFDLRGAGDHEPLAPVAHRYRCGYDETDIEYCLESLRALHQDMARRSTVVRDLPRDLCPEAKITSALASNRSLGLHPVVVGIDECHMLFKHKTYGQELAEICEDLMRRGPALGIIAMLATQRPDPESVPSGISTNAVVRACFKVQRHNENDAILQSGAYGSGIRATSFTKNDKGLCYFIGDDEPHIMRTVYTDTIQADAIVARARALREKHGTITGYAAGQDLASTTKTSPARSTLLEDVRAVFPTGQHKEWGEVILTRLVELRPDVYADWTQTQLTAALKPYGISTSHQTSKTDPATGRETNRRGLLRTEVDTALARRNHRPAA
ncbi:cell division protein FtsK [Amycolatopsis sp. NPDC059027]|uniref:cell division protein FtsK n=1 Tax=Amycolatopsis sp. NPDC059027 TaxID=3346709 RepID=UPI00366BFD3C